MHKINHEDDIRSIETEEEWYQFIELTRENFPEDIDKVIQEGLEYHQKDGYYLFGYFKNKRLIGSIGLYIVESKSLGIIGYLQVAQKSRNVGIAHKLYNKIRKLVETKLCRYLYLAVYANNKQAISIYRHWGFKDSPMIYKITKLSNKEFPRSKNNIKILKKHIKTERELEKIILDMYNEYYLFNEIYHYFEAMYDLYKTNSIHIRKICGKTHILVIIIDNDIEAKSLIFLLEKRKNSLIALKKELMYIEKKNNSLKRKIIHLKEK